MDGGFIVGLAYIVNISNHSEPFLLEVDASSGDVIPGCMVRGRKNPLHFGLGKRLRAVRRQRDIGGKPLSIAAGLAVTTVLRIESEASVPSVDVVAKLATVLHVSPGYLAYGIEPSPPSSVDESTMTLAERLRQVRELSGLSLNTLAKVSGVARTTIGYIESGQTSPSIATVELLARALGVSVCWLAYAEGVAQDVAAVPTSTPDSLSERSA